MLQFATDDDRKFSEAITRLESMGYKPEWLVTGNAGCNIDNYVKVDENGNLSIRAIVTYGKGVKFENV